MKYDTVSITVGFQKVCFFPLPSATVATDDSASSVGYKINAPTDAASARKIIYL